MNEWTKMSLEDVKKRVIAAICALYRHDRELLDVDANERSITHKLAEHLQREFPEWHVDCEYNRVGRETKRLAVNVGKPKPDDLEAKTVFSRHHCAPQGEPKKPFGYGGQERLWTG